MEKYTLELLSVETLTTMLEDCTMRLNAESDMDKEQMLTIATLRFNLITTMHSIIGTEADAIALEVARKTLEKIAPKEKCIECGRTFVFDEDTCCEFDEGPLCADCLHKNSVEDNAAPPEHSGTVYDYDEDETIDKLVQLAREVASAVQLEELSILGIRPVTIEGKRTPAIQVGNAETLEAFVPIHGQWEKSERPSAEYTKETGALCFGDVYVYFIEK